MVMICLFKIAVFWTPACNTSFLLFWADCHLTSIMFQDTISLCSLDHRSSLVILNAVKWIDRTALQFCAQLTVPYLSRYYECLRQRSLCSDSNKSNSLHLYNVYYVLGTLTNLVFKITLWDSCNHYGNFIEEKIWTQNNYCHTQGQLQENSCS